MSELEISEAKFKMAEFDSDNRYIRQVGNPAEAVAWMVEGPSIRLTPGSGGTDGQYAWSFECGPVIIRSFYDISPTSPVAPMGFANSKPIAL